MFLLHCHPPKRASRTYALGDHDLPSSVPRHTPRGCPRTSQTASLTGSAEGVNRLGITLLASQDTPEGSSSKDQNLERKHPETRHLPSFRNQSACPSSAFLPLLLLAQQSSRTLLSPSLSGLPGRGTPAGGPVLPTLPAPDAGHPRPPLSPLHPANDMETRGPAREERGHQGPQLFTFFGGPTAACSLSVGLELEEVKPPTHRDPQPLCQGVSSVAGFPCSPGSSYFCAPAISHPLSTRLWYTCFPGRSFPTSSAWQTLTGFRDSTQMLNFPVAHLLPARASPASSQETLCSVKSEFIPLQPGQLEPAYGRQKLFLSHLLSLPQSPSLPESDTQRVKCTCAHPLIRSVNPGALEQRQRQDLRAGEVYILTGETDDKHTDITRLVLGS